MQNLLSQLLSGAEGDDEVANFFFNLHNIAACRLAPAFETCFAMLILLLGCSIYR